MVFIAVKTQSKGSVWENIKGKPREFDLFVGFEKSVDKIKL